jgi:hypothetical protein
MPSGRYAANIPFFRPALFGPALPLFGKELNLERVFQEVLSGRGSLFQKALR